MVLALTMGFLSNTPLCAAADDNPCAMFGETAENLMLVRQRGTELSAMIADARAVENPQARVIMLSLINDAADWSIESDVAGQERAAAEFRTVVEAVCHEELG